MCRFWIKALLHYHRAYNVGWSGLGDLLGLVLLGAYLLGVGDVLLEDMWFFVCMYWIIHYYIKHSSLVYSNTYMYSNQKTYNIWTNNEDLRNAKEFWVEPWENDSQKNFQIRFIDINVGAIVIIIAPECNDWQFCQMRERLKVLFILPFLRLY